MGARAVIAFGVCAGPSGKIDQYVRPSLARFEPHAPLLVRTGQTSIHEAYNSLLEEAAGLADLDALVLMHDDVELLETVSGSLRELFADRSVAVVGVIGSTRHRGIGWFHSEPQTHRGRVLDATQGRYDFGGGTHSVDTVDGLFLALSPWAVRHLRFDTTRYVGFHGYDAEICARARAAGKQVLVAEVSVHHHAKPADIDSRRWKAANYTYLDIWERPRPSVAHAVWWPLRARWLRWRVRTEESITQKSSAKKSSAGKQRSTGRAA